ncbi:hypothetical protein ScPMuIL_015210 [Solemya velum]
MIIFIALVSLFLIGAVFYSKKFRRNENDDSEIPGPGTLLFLKRVYSVGLQGFHLCLDEFGHIYGSIFGFSCMGQQFVFLNKKELIKSALSCEEFQARPRTIFSEHLMRHEIGWTSDMEEHQRLRKILHKALSIYGDGVQKFENVVSKEIESLCRRIEAQNGADFCMNDFLKDSLVNLVSILLSGKRIEDHEGDSFDVDVIWNYIESCETVAHPLTMLVLSVFPFLRNMPGYWGNVYEENKKTRERILDIFYSSMKETYVPGKIRGIVDVLFEIQEKERSRETQWLTDAHVQGTILDIVVAGLVTSHHTLSAFFLTLLHYPTVQRKIHKEIGDVIGFHEPPCLNDRPQMPYTQASVLENFRCSSIVPIGLPRRAIRESLLDGFVVRKNAVISPCLSSLHHDDTIYDDPHIFHAERFLDDKGKLLPQEDSQHQSLLPFGYGRRQCPGETFAKSRIFLYITTLVQKFEFLVSGNAPLPEWDPITYDHKLTSIPPRFMCCTKTYPRDP